MSQEHAERHLEVLCKLPLGELALLRGIIELLHDIVPSRWNGGGLFHDDGRPGPGFGEHEAFVSIAARWHTECAGSFGKNLTSETLHRVNAAGQTLVLQNGDYETSDVYQRLFKPAGVKWFLDLPVGDETGPLGGILLLRGPDQPRFTTEDSQRLEAVRPCIAKSLRAARVAACATNRPPVVLAPVTTQSGYVLAGLDGHVKGVTKDARFVLELMSAGTYALPDFSGVVPARVARLVSQLCAGLRDENGNGKNGPPYHELDNGFGGFRMTASKIGGRQLPPEFPLSYELAVMGEVDVPFVSILTEYREPLILHVARAMRATGLPPAQVHIGTLLATGSSQPEIAALLGVKRSSVDDAVRKIYERVGVHSAIELAWRFAGPVKG